MRFDQGRSAADHILTQLSLTANPDAVPGGHINFLSVPAPVFIQKQGGFGPSTAPDGTPREVQLSHLNEARLKMAVEMARLDVERMKLAEPITIVSTSKAPPSTAQSSSGGSNEAPRAKTKPRDDKKQQRVDIAVQNSSALHPEEKCKEEIHRCRQDLVSSIDAMVAKARQQPEDFEPSEQRKHTTRINQQGVRSARNLYSLQQQIREVQHDLDRMQSGASNSSRSRISILNKLLAIHRGVLKATGEVLASSSGGIERQLSRVYSELAHLIRQMNLICDEMDLEVVDLKPQALDTLSAGEIPLDKETQRVLDESLTRVEGRDKSPPLSPDREKAIRAGIIALGKNESLADKYQLKTSKAVKPKAQQRGRIYNRPPPPRMNKVKSNVAQATVASHLKSVHSDMLVRGSATSPKRGKSSNHSLAVHKPRQSSPINHKSVESLHRYGIDESTILTSSRHSSPAHDSSLKRRKSPEERSQKPLSHSRPPAEIMARQRVAEEIEAYAKETREAVEKMKYERITTQRLFDRQHGMSLEAYNDIRDIAKIKLKRFIVDDPDAREVYKGLCAMSDAKFRFVVKECSLGYKTFDYEEISESVLDFLVEEYMQNESNKQKIASGINQAKFKIPNIGALQDILSRLDQIEEEENEIRQRIKLNYSVPVKEDRKSVHFKTTPTLFSTDENVENMIVVDKSSRDPSKPAAIPASERSDVVPHDQRGRDEEMSPSLMIEIPPEVVEGVEESRQSRLQTLSENLNVDVTSFDPGALLDKMTSDILEDLLRDVMNDVSSVCDGFAEAIYKHEFTPSL